MSRTNRPPKYQIVMRKTIIDPDERAARLQRLWEILARLGPASKRVGGERKDRQ